MTKENKLEVKDRKPLRLLMVEDSEDDVLLIVRNLKKGGCNPVYERVETAAAMKKALQEKQWDIILCDYKMPKFDAPSAIAVLKESNIDIPIIIVSGTIGEDVAVECMRLGAHDYIMKGNLSRLCPAITRELEDTEVRVQRKRVEDALRVSEGKYRTILEDMQEGYFEVDLGGNFTFFNDSMCRLYGYSKEEFMGMNYRQYTDKENSKILFQAYHKVYNTGEPNKGFDWQIIKKDGTKKYVAGSVSLQKDSSGKPKGFRGIVRDVTDRKQTEEALQKSEAKYRQLFDNAPSAIYQIDFRTGKFLKANDIICEYFGCSQEEITSLSPYDLLTKESQILFLERLGKIAIGDQVPADPEFEFVDKNGKTRWLKLNSKIYYDSEGLAGADVVAHDITERKLAEEMLELNFETQAAINILLGLSLEGRPIKEFLYSALDLVLSLKWLAIESKGAIFLADKAGETLHLQAQKGLSKELCAMCKTVPYGHCLCGKAAATRAFQFADRVDERHNTHYEGMPPHGHYCVPIISGDHVLGVIVLYVKEGHIRSPWEEDFLKAVANSLAGTIERRQAEEDLKESEKKYRLLADNVDDVIFVLDMNLNYTYISPSVKSLRGYEPEELLNKSPTDTITPSSLDLAMKTLSEIMELEKSGRRDEIPVKRMLQLEMTRKDGTTLWTDVKFSLIRDENQRIAAIMGVTRDITERKQAEEELRKSEERYRLIAENTADTIAVFDLNLNPTYISPSILKLRGYTVQEAMTQTLDQTLTPDSLQQASKNFADQMALELSGTTDPTRTALMELEEYCKDGSTIWVELAASFLRDNNFKPTGVLTITRDITERKRAEVKLQQTLESLRKAIGTTIQVLISALEARDPYTAGHQIRVANLARAIAMEMGLVQDKIEGIRMAGSIHDIGKLSIPAEILSKPTKLTNTEFSLIKEHSQIGYEMLKDVESPWPLAQIVYQHHERMNGSGYPRNLKGDEILMEARIMAVADVVEAMASHRPYRAALGIDVALAEIEKNKGIFYDDTVADACLKLFREKGYKLD